MDAKEAFSVAIRVVGLLSLGRCVTDLAFVATYLIGNENISVTAKFPGADFVIGVFFLGRTLSFAWSTLDRELCLSARIADTKRRIG